MLSELEKEFLFECIAIFLDINIEDVNEDFVICEDGNKTTLLSILELVEQGSTIDIDYYSIEKDSDLETIKDLLEYLE